MMPPVRRLAALCMLLIFSVFLAEGVWAALCLDDGALRAESTADAERGHDLSGSDHGGHCPPSGESERAGTPPCPLAPAGSGCLTTSLPGVVVALADATVRGIPARPSADLLPDRPIVSGIERPPRA